MGAPEDAVLRRHRVALVPHDAIADHPRLLTVDWTYLRFHGRHYRGGYSAQALAGHARRIRRWLGKGHDVWAYFNNDVGGHAPGNAAERRRYVEGLQPGGSCCGRPRTRSRVPGRRPRLA